MFSERPKGDDFMRTLEGQGRAGSRSPRRGEDEEVEAEGYVEGQGPEVPDWDGAGLPPPGGKSHFVGQMRSTASFLEKFMNGPPKDTLEPAPREFYAGIPLEAARGLLLGPADAPRPWLGLPAHVACLAAASRLFDVLLPQQAEEGLCERLCALAASAGSMDESPSASCLFEAASSWKLTASAASQATDSLQAMVRGKPVACCVVLDDYVAVLEDAETGEEAEEEVGAHCVMVIGGDLSGPNFVVFDPWGAQGGVVVFWGLHELEKAAPSAWVELVPTDLSKFAPATRTVAAPTA